MRRLHALLFLCCLCLACACPAFSEGGTAVDLRAVRDAQGRLESTPVTAEFDVLRDGEPVCVVTANSGQRVDTTAAGEWALRVRAGTLPEGVELSDEPIPFTGGQELVTVYAQAAPPPPASLEGRVMLAGSPFAQAQLVLLTPDGEETAAVTPDASGAFAMDNLPAGAYTLRVVLPGEYLTEGAPDIALTLAGGQTHTVEIAVLRAARVRGALAGLAGAQLTLLDGQTALSVTPDASGAFEIAGLRAGEYTLRVALPQGAYAAGEGWQAQSGALEYALSLAQGEERDVPTLRVAQAASVSGVVWLDDGDGVYENERGVSGVQVTLLSGETQLAAATTDAQGEYIFDGVLPGEYRVRVAETGSRALIAPTAGGSDFYPDGAGGGVSAAFTLGEGEQARLIAGVANDATLVMQVFEDKNENGGRANSEPDIAGALVEIVFFAPDGERYVAASALTDKTGMARLTGVPAGECLVAVTLPEGYFIGPLGAKVSKFYNCYETADSRTGMLTASFAPGEIKGLGAGAVRTGALAGRVWLDADFDGAMAETEGGVTGVTVTLAGALGTQTAVTDETGAFAFAQARAGAYTLTALLPEGLMFAAEGDSLLTAMGTREDSAAVHVQKGETARLAIGAAPATGLTLLAFEDANANGVMDAGEAPLPGAVLTLVLGGQDAASAKTDAAGYARLPMVRSGAAVLRCTLPEGKTFTVSAPGGSAFDAPSAVSEYAIPFDIKPAQDNLVYAGAALSAAVSGLVFEDANNNGVYDAGERALPGVTVSAVNAAGDAVALTFTDENGAYTLRSLLPAAHRVCFALPVGYMFAAEAQGEAANDVTGVIEGIGQTALVALAPGETHAGLDAGMLPAATVTGRVYLADGRDASACEGADGVTVRLLDAQGAPIPGFEDTTGADGVFAIAGVAPGTYAVSYGLPDACLFYDSARNGRAFTGEPFALATGQTQLCEALGVVRTGSVSGTAYHDADLNGAPQGDARLAGVTLTLVPDDARLETLRAVTDAQGAFAFTELRPGGYTLTAALPEGMLFAAGDGQAFPAGAQTQESAALTIGMGQPLALEIGAVYPAALSGALWLDANDDGVWDAGEAPLPNAALTLSGVGATIALRTGQNGDFLLPALHPGEYTLTVTLDERHTLCAGTPGFAQTGDRYARQLTLRENEPVEGLNIGVVTLAELSGTFLRMADRAQEGVAGVALTLAGPQGAQYTAVTDGNGAYAFPGLRPGDYTLTAALGAPFRFVRAQDESRATSLGEDGVYARALTLRMGEALALTLHAGAAGQLGDVAWLDENGNGLQDEGEPGLSGVRVEAYFEGELAASTVTDAYGRYLLAGLQPGAYELRVTPDSALRPTTPRTDYAMISSVLAETDGATATAAVAVPDGGRNLAADLGFVLRPGETLPDGLTSPPATDWSFGR